eukprot:g19314.t1
MKTSSLNVGKTKEPIINFRKNGGEHVPIYINGTEDAVTVKVQQCLFFLWWLRKFSTSIKTLTNFYICTIESLLSGCMTAWYGSCSAQDLKELQKVVCTAQTMTEANLSSMGSICTARCCGKAANNIKDP